MNQQNGDKPGPGDDGDGQGALLVERETRVEKPRLYKVLLHNDDYTPMDFVVDVLQRFFQRTQAEATEIMLAVHHKGVGVCGTYPYEIAETKVALVTECAREHEYPLQCTLEPA